MSRIPRRSSKSKVALATALLGLAGSLGVVAATASPAAAATGCGSKCDNKDPQSYAWKYTGPSPGTPNYCATDKVTKKSKSRVELRYSAACRTAWAKLASTGAPGEVWHLEVRSYKNGVHRKTVYSENDSGFTNMVNDADMTAKACVVWSYSADSDEESEQCTDPY